MIEEEEGSKANVNYLNESPGAIRLGRTSDDERDCCGLREDEILGFEDDTFVGSDVQKKTQLLRIIIKKYSV